MRVAVIPGDETGCGTYRMILPADAVMKARPDWQVDLYKPGSIEIGSDKDGKLIGLKGLNEADKLDILVMQRVGNRASVAFTHWARQKGIATVVDADDAMWCIDKDNRAHKQWNSKALNWRYMDSAAQDADLVTVTTEHLARRYGKHGRVEIIPNYVPSEVFNYEKPTGHDETVVSVGWTGFVATHPHDLKVVGDAVYRALADTGAVARVVGDAGGVGREWGLDEEIVQGIAPQPLGPLYFGALSTIDIGLVPLADTPFNKGKSWLKALEFSAMGIPVIATPTPNNILLSRQVPIMLARTPDEWYEHLRWLIEHDYQREQRGIEAREAVRANFTLESAGEKWAQAWERAYNRRARMAA